MASEGARSCMCECVCVWVREGEGECVMPPQDRLEIRVAPSLSLPRFLTRSHPLALEAPRQSLVAAPRDVALPSPSL